MELNDIPMPKVSAGKLLIEVHAAGVNPSDWKIRQGYMGKLTFPATLGGDFAGIITKVGEGVTSFKKGDEVFGNSNVLSGGSGSFAQFTLIDTSHIALKPKNLSMQEAGAIPLTGISAVQGLLEHLKLTKGQKILIQGGAGGIGTMAIQIAKDVGAHIATTAKTEDLEYVKSLGADETIDYKTQKFEDVLSGYDAVFDTVGGETYERSFKVLKKGGMIVSMEEKPNDELMKRYEVIAISEQARVRTERLQRLAEFVEKGAVIVHIEKSFPLEQAGDALAYLEQKHPNGKIILKIR